MGMVVDLSAQKAADDELARLRRVEVAARAVVEEWESHNGDLLMGRKVRELKSALQGPPVVRTVVWDIDPKKHFARVGGKLVAQAIEQADGTWRLHSEDNRSWPTFRSAEAARKAFEESRAEQTAPAQSDGLRFIGGSNWFVAHVAGADGWTRFASGQPREGGHGYWVVTFMSGHQFTLDHRSAAEHYVRMKFEQAKDRRVTA